jgi:formylglycine-generating enzyme
MEAHRFFAAAAIAVAISHASPTLAETAAGTPFRDCPQCPEMVPLPGGSFTMGASPGEAEREQVYPAFRGHAQPQVTVNIGAFAVGRYEVTRSEFAAFVAETGHEMRSDCNIPAVREWGIRGGWEHGWLKPGFVQTDRHPAVCIRWTDAKAYAAWLSRKTGKAYRLPSEAEWEYAARAGSQAPRPWGDAAGDACQHANAGDASVIAAFPGTKGMHACSDGFLHTAPVGSFKPSRFGLHDMIGNASEWVEDCWADTLAGMPTNGAPRLSGDCQKRVERGGSWRYGPAIARSAQRYWEHVTVHHSEIGFRVAREP